MVSRLPALPDTVRASRTPAWRVDCARPRPCPTCGEHRRRSLTTRPDGVPVCRCDGCAMLFVPVTPRQDEIARFYESYAGFKGYGARRSGLLRRTVQSLANPYISVLQASGGLYGRR